MILWPNNIIYYEEVQRCPLSSPKSISQGQRSKQKKSLRSKEWLQFWSAPQEQLKQNSNSGRLTQVTTRMANITLCLKPPHFDVQGIWRFKNVAFSKHGNLKKTIVHLVVSSSTGLTGRQLGEILGLSPQSFVHHLCNYSGVNREKHAGVFVYFSDEPLAYMKQIRRGKLLSTERLLLPFPIQMRSWFWLL